MSSDVVDEDAAAGGAKCALDPASDYPAFVDADYRMQQKTAKIVQQHSDTTNYDLL